MELWVAGQSDVYTLEAKTKKAKEDFAAELRNRTPPHWPQFIEKMTTRYFLIQRINLAIDCLFSMSLLLLRIAKTG